MINFNSYNWFTASVIEGSDLWFVPERGAKLLHCDIDSGRIDFCGNIPNESQLVYGNYAGMVKVAEFLIMAPSMAEEVAIYNLFEKKFYKIPVVNPENITDKFVWGISVGNSAYFIGYFYPAILEYNIEFKSCRLYSFHNLKEVKCVKNSAPFFDDSFCLVNDSLMFPCYNSGHIMQFNLRTKQFSLHLIDENVHLRTISYDGKYCWISVKEKEGFFLWNPVTKELCMDLLQESVQTGNELRYYYTCNINDKIYIFPCASNEIYLGYGKKLRKLDLGEELNKIAKVEYLTYDLQKRKFLFLKKTEDGRIYTYSSISNKVYIFNQYEVKSLEIKIPEEMIYDFASEYLEERRADNKNDIIMCEQEIAGGLKVYLKYISKNNTGSAEERKKEIEDASNDVAAKILKWSV